MESGPKGGQEVKVGAVLLMTTHETVRGKLLLLQLLNVSSYTKEHSFLIRNRQFP